MASGSGMKHIHEDARPLAIAVADDAQPMKKNRSPVWLEMEKFNANGETKARCNLCGAIFACGPRTGTSHLKRHLEFSCPERTICDSKQLKLSGQSYTNRSTSSNTSKFGYNDSRDAFVACEKAGPKSLPSDLSTEKMKREAEETNTDAEGLPVAGHMKVKQEPLEFQNEEEARTAGVPEIADFVAEVAAPDAEIAAPGNGEELTLRIADSLLNCTICSNLLSPPIYQCSNGHVACYPCCSKLCVNRCRVCTAAGGYTSRAAAVENLLAATTVACANCVHGCCQRVPFYDCRAHEASCAHIPFQCPVAACTFCGSSSSLARHFDAGSNHPDIISKNISYGRRLRLTLHGHQPSVVLLCKDVDAVGCFILFLLLNEDRREAGNALSVVGIGAQAGGEEFEFGCEITARRKGSSVQLQMKTPTVITRRWKSGEHPLEASLLVPTAATGGAVSNMIVDVRIAKIKRLMV